MSLRVRILWLGSLLALLPFISGCGIGAILAVIIGALSGSDDSGGGNSQVAPSVAIDTIERTDGVVAIPITVFDANGDDATLVVEYDAGGGFNPASATPTTVSASQAGTDHVLAWNAALDLGSNAYVSGVLIRITPSDAQSGIAVTSDPFDYGNDAPAITATSLDTDGSGKVSGDAVVRFTVTDSSSDTIQVTAFEYSLLGDFTDAVLVPLTTGVGGNFPSGSIANLTSSPGGTNHSFTWDSYAVAPVSASDAKIRLKLKDPLGGDSGFSESQAFDLANDTFVMIGSITRTTGQVSVPLTVFNTASLMVTLTAEYDLGHGAGFVAASTSPVQLPGSPGGTPGVLMWDAPTDLGATAYEGNVILRITPDDGVTTGPQETSDPFEFGNDAPVVTVLSVDTDGDGKAGGNIIVRFTVTDSASDTIELTQFEFSLAGDFSDVTDVPLTTGQAGNFPGGSLVNLLTDPTPGVEHSIAWNSTLLAPVDNIGTKVRMKVQDAPFNDEAAFQASQAFELTNGDPHPPIAQITSVKRADGNGLRTGAVRIDYRLIDEDGDAVDVIVEYSTNGKETWNPASEYPGTASDGRYDLSATVGGIQHRFVWDASADLAVEEPQVHLRVTPAAVDGVGLAGETSIDISISANPGVALFAAPQDLSAGAGTSFVRIADLDRDGFPDLVAVNSAGNSLSVFLGRGDGSFKSPTTLAVAGDPRQVTIADFDNDELLDLAVTSFAGNKAQVLLGNGDGTFDAASDINLGAMGGGPHSIASADFDADGNVDLVVAGTTNKQFIALRGNGNGTFASPTLTSTDNEARGISVGDINGDGNFDAVLAASDSGKINTMIGDGLGAFTQGTDASVNDDPFDVVLGYFNADRHLDMAAVNTKNTKEEISVFIGNGDGTFVNDVIYLSGEFEPRSLKAADINNDGITDLIVVNGTTSLSLLTGVGNGTFNTAVLTGGVSNARHVEIGDVNLDGLADAVVARDSGIVSILLGRRDGDTWFRAMTAWPAGNTVGATTLPGGNDLHGNPRINRFGQRMFHAFGDNHPDDLRAGQQAEAHNFLQMLHQSGATPIPASMEALTRAQVVTGDIRLMRVPDPGSTDTGYRIQPLNRFGDRITPGSSVDFEREGLDLSDASFANQRGIVVDLPIIGGGGGGSGARSNAEINAALGVSKIHVWLRTSDWLRAADIPADPLNGEANDGDFLPRLDMGGGVYRDTYVERHTWIKLPQAASNNLNNGSDARYMVDLSGPRRVRVLMDRGGVIQVFYQP